MDDDFDRVCFDFDVDDDLGLDLEDFVGVDFGLEGDLDIPGGGSGGAMLIVLLTSSLGRGRVIPGGGAIVIVIAISIVIAPPPLPPPPSPSTGCGLGFTSKSLIANSTFQFCAWRAILALD